VHSVGSLTLFLFRDWCSRVLEAEASLLWSMKQPVTVTAAKSCYLYVLSQAAFEGVLSVSGMPWLPWGTEVLDPLKEYITFFVASVCARRTGMPGI
jgi:hypothetical protein